MADSVAELPAHLGGARAEVEVKRRGWIRRLLAFVGPAYLVSVGYMDPGNWATDIEGGARFGYTLIWVILMSNFMAILLQTLAARFGIATGLDLAQGCRREYPRPVTLVLWGLAEIAIAATDLAEALGTIIGLNLLFGIPLLWGCAVTALDTFLLLALQRFGMRKIEAVILLMVATIGGCFIIEVFLAKPDWGGIATGFIPRFNPSALYIVTGIIGATVMPHNLYLHSSLVQSRAVSNTVTGKREACRFNFIDSVVALNAAFFVNCAILIMAAANFHSRGIEVTELKQAHALLEGLLGHTLAPLVFAVALIAAGQSSTITGTISGQIVMEGFLNLRLRPWLRRLITRAIALLPAVVVIAMAGDRGAYSLLILSQVILSLQLPFATIPLIHFTSDKNKMGAFANKRWVVLVAWAVACIIVVLNGKLVYDGLSGALGGGLAWLWPIAVAFVMGCLALLAYIVLKPWIHPGRVWESARPSLVSHVAGRIQPMPLKEIGVALEHSEGDAEVISAAMTLARANKACLTLIHIVETPGTLVYGEESASRHGAEDKEYLEQLAREIEARDLPVEILLRRGKPVDELVRITEEFLFDLVVFGA
ncbi:MAG: Nramp family divalent metal transporter, partial [Candidatus Hydrogenedentes bacterium]|nr:Nramp family divalent metal transporter [Candidatus Hydrogenedentota bacterium]